MRRCSRNRFPGRNHWVLQRDTAVSSLFPTTYDIFLETHYVVAARLGLYRVYQPLLDMLSPYFKGCLKSLEVTGLARFPVEKKRQKAARDPLMRLTA